MISGANSARFILLLSWRWSGVSFRAGAMGKSTGGYRVCWIRFERMVVCIIWHKKLVTEQRI